MKAKKRTGLAGWPHSLSYSPKDDKAGKDMQNKIGRELGSI